MSISPQDLRYSERLVFKYLAATKEVSLAAMPFVGPKTVVKLVGLGLIEAMGQDSLGEPCYCLTKAGKVMHAELSKRFLIPL
jgi:hypothetical protein